MQAHKQSRHRRPPFPHPTVIDVDPTDPAQTLDESTDFHVEPLDVSVQPSAEADDDVDRAAAEVEPGDDAAEPAQPHDTGDLYGVHVSPADDRELGARSDHDDYVDADSGEHFFEVLEQHATESGPTPEHEVTVIDDSDPHDDHPPTDFRDRPKADRGSGGPGGL